MHFVYSIMVCQKAPVGLSLWSNSVKIKPVHSLKVSANLSILLTLGISQSVSQSADYSMTKVLKIANLHNPVLYILLITD